ncbi:MAG: hypothetical protein GY822_29465 [Deltaproteobacteria bacterium]|nr:hypothetical protein [Deltaproteobacteria bacterium]
MNVAKASPSNAFPCLRIALQDDTRNQKDIRGKAMAKKSKKNLSKNSPKADSAPANSAAKTKKAPENKAAHSQAFRDFKAAYDAGNYSLTQKLARDLSGMNDDERPEAQQLAALTRIDPTALAIGFAVVALVLVVGWTLLTAA